MADPVSLVRLAALADAATPGPWAVQKAGEFVYVNGGDGLRFGVTTMYDTPDAEFIAACDPVTVKHLIQAVQAAQTLVALYDDELTGGHPVQALRSALAVFSTGEPGE